MRKNRLAEFVDVLRKEQTIIKKYKSINNLILNLLYMTSMYNEKNIEPTIVDIKLKAIYRQIKRTTFDWVNNSIYARKFV